MSDEEIVLTIDPEDAPRLQMLLWELGELLNEMRVGGSPFADRMDGALDRFQRHFLKKAGRSG